MLTIQLLGQPTATIGPRELRLGAKGFGLLGYLLFENKDVYSVEDITDLLWPRVPADSARHSFSQLIYQIRRLSGFPKLLVRKRDKLHFDRTLSRSDIQTFRNAIKAGDLPTAFQTYKGEFLEGLVVDADDRFDHWKDSAAASLQHAFRRCLQGLIDADTNANPADLEQWTRISLALDPFDSRVAAAHYQAIAEQNRIAEALAGIADYARFLATEGPSKDTQPLKDLECRLASVSRTGAADVARLGHPAFVGRELELRWLRQEWLKAASGKRSCVCIVGEPGQGKSRLAEQLGKFAAIRGGHVVSTSGSPAARRVAYAVVADMADQLLRINGVCDELGSPAIRQILSSDIAIAAAPLVERAIYAEMVGIVRTVGATCPLLLLIDDVQWIDESSLDVLKYLVHQTPDVGIMVVLCMRSESIHVCNHFAELTGCTVHELGPLRREDAVALAGALCRLWRSTPDSIDLERLLRKASGNPYFLTALTEHALSVQDGSHSAALPPTISALLSARIRSLPFAAREILRCLAVLQDATTIETLARLCSLSVLSAARAAETLIQFQFAVDRAGSIRIVHDLMSEVAYETTPSSVRCVLHSRAAELFAGRSDGLAALHAFKAGNMDAAFDAAFRAMDETKRLNAHKETEFYLQLAWDAAATAERRGRAAAAYVFHLCELDRPTASVEYIPTARAYCAEVGDIAGQIRCEGVELDSALRSGARPLPDIIAEIETLVTAAERIGEHDLAAQLVSILARAGELGGAVSVLDQCLTLGTRIAHNASAKWKLPLLGRLAVFRFYRGDEDRARALAEELTKITDDDVRLQSIACAYRGTVLMLLGRLHDAEECFHRGLALANDPVLVDAYFKSAVNLAVVEVDIGKYGEAEKHLSVRSVSNAWPTMVTLANIGVLALERQDWGAVERAIATLEAFSEEVHVVASMLPTLRGWLALSTSDHIAAQREAEILIPLFARCAYDSDDSYARTLVARVVGHSRPTAAIDVLDGATATKRAAVPQLRIDLERAYHLRRIDRDAGDAALREVKARAEEMGALPIAKRAQVVLDGGELP